MTEPEPCSTENLDVPKYGTSLTDLPVEILEIILYHTLARDDQEEPEPWADLGFVLLFASAPDEATVQKEPEPDPWAGCGLTPYVAMKPIFHVSRVTRRLCISLTHRNTIWICTRIAACFPQHERESYMTSWKELSLLPPEYRYLMGSDPAIYYIHIDKPEIMFENGPPEALYVETTTRAVFPYTHAGLKHVLHSMRELVGPDKYTDFRFDKKNFVGRNQEIFVDEITPICEDHAALCSQHFGIQN